jgi:hypothetical protein
MSDKRTMTLNLTDEEMSAVERYATEHQMSKTAVLRQALRLYDLVQRRLADGETFGFSGDQDRAVAFAGIGFPMQEATKE